MAEKNASRQATTSPSAIRNVVLVGPTSAGKTTLFENLLFTAKAVTKAGSVEDGTTVSDWTDIEKRQQRSVGLGVATFDYQGTRINLIDAPGFADFVGEVGAGLRAADAALFVVPAKSGFDGNTRLIWEACAQIDMPRAIVVSKIDTPETDVAARVQELRRELGNNVLSFEVPLNIQEVIDLIKLNVHKHDSGGHTMRPATDEEKRQVIELRAALLEAIISEADDVELMEEYLSDKELDSASLRRDVVSAVAHARFFPVMFTATTPPHFGVQEILDLIVEGFPSPELHSIPSVTALGTGKTKDLSADPAAALVAEVFKTATDPYLGRLSYIRVFSGRMQTGDVVHVSGHFTERSGHSDHDVDEKIGGLSFAVGKEFYPVNGAVSGDIVVVSKLTSAETGDTLSAKADPVIMPTWQIPDPLYPVAIAAKARTDEDKLSEALKRIAAEDPSVFIERNGETHQTVLWCQGESHADVLLDRMRAGFGVATEVVPFKVPLRETLAKPAVAEGRHVKQSGGHGQYAVAKIAVEPLAAGSEFEFVDEVVGGAVPRQYIPSVEHGIRQQMAKGLHAGYPVVNIRVRLQDGKAHSVDSSDMAFQMAGQLALQDAAAKAGVVMLEPVSEVTIEVDDQYVGAILSDVPSRRGRISGTSQASINGRTVITAEIPDLELVTYAITLRSLAHGTGRFSRTLSGYEPLPANIAAKLTAST